MICCVGAESLTEAAALLSLGKVFKAVGCTSLGFFVLLDVPRQLGGDVGDKEAAWSQTMIVSSHPELTVLGDKTDISPMSRVLTTNHLLNLLKLFLSPVKLVSRC